MHKYGYYEIRCRLPKNPGWHAAFWLQAPGIGSSPDASACGVKPILWKNYRQHTDNIMLCGNGYGGYGKNSVWPGHFKHPFKETADGWHYYGVDWNKDGYTFYMDGEKVGFQGCARYARQQHRGIYPRQHRVPRLSQGLSAKTAVTTDTETCGQESPLTSFCTLFCPTNLWLTTYAFF
ncbi:MAG: glycoside hydrolase family 16 protein [Clostridiales bacterium]|nr:MAG: glycoside hydrolase family 16 protein [Clostridiales bacterium]